MVLDEIGFEHKEFDRLSRDHSKKQKTSPISVAEKGLGRRFDKEETKELGNYLKYAQLLMYSAGRYNVRVTDHPAQRKDSQLEMYLFGEPVSKQRATEAYDSLDEILHLIF